MRFGDAGTVAAVMPDLPAPPPVRNVHGLPCFDAGSVAVETALPVEPPPVFHAGGIEPVDAGTVAVEMPELAAPPPVLDAHGKPVGEAGPVGVGTALPAKTPPVLHAGGIEPADGGSVLVEMPAPPAPPPVRNAGGHGVTGGGVRELLGQARLDGSYLDLGSDGATFVARVHDAGTSGLEFFARVGHRPLTALGTCATDGTGCGELRLAVPVLSALAANLEVEVFGVYRDARGQTCRTETVVFLLQAKPVEHLSFDWSVGGTPLAAGTVLGDQWSAEGLSIRAENTRAAGPDLAILFASEQPTGDDADLSTPGVGPGNDIACGKLLIVAENADDRDDDGLIDVPDAAAAGGRIFFDFDREVVLSEIALIDVDVGQRALLRTFAGNRLVQDIEVLDLGGNLGDNGRVRVGFASEPITRLEVSLDGSAGIADLAYVPGATRVDFDTSATGNPLGIVAGEPLERQLAENLGFELRGENWRAEAPRAGVLFDSAHPTGGDTDLATPGSHPTNREAQGFVLILQENARDLDGDGIYDVPDDEAFGGMLTFEFEFPVVFHSASVLDIDVGEVSYLDLFSKHVDGTCARYDLVATLPLADLGDNSLQTLVETIPGVDRIDVVLGGSGALVDLSFSRDESLP